MSPSVDQSGYVREVEFHPLDGVGQALQELVGFLEGQRCLRQFVNEFGALEPGSDVSVGEAGISPGSCALQPVAPFAVHLPRERFQLLATASTTWRNAGPSPEAKRLVAASCRSLSMAFHREAGPHAHWDERWRFPMVCTAVPTTEEALASRLLQSTIHTLEVFSIYLGKALGLYAALASGGRVTPPELARTAGIAPRYAREWLEQQAVAGLLRVEPVAALADERRYWLPAEHVNVLVIEDHPAHLAPLSQMVAGIAGVLDRVVEAYRTGAGVPYPQFGTAFRQGQAGINKPAFLADLVERWIPAAADLHERLSTAHLRVADVGCGAGWSTIAVARAYPGSDVVGFDADAASIADARANAAAAHLNLRFEIADATRVSDAGPFDLILVLEALHDMSRPLEALRALRRALGSGGTLLIADEKVAAHFHAPADEIERLMYGWSIVHCLPVSLAETPSAAIGTVMRAETVRDLARDAGFARVDVLPVDGGFFRLYRLGLS
jgi:SAM-dependent methyltransferase